MRAPDKSFGRHADGMRNLGSGRSLLSVLALVAVFGAASGCASEQKTPAAETAAATATTSGWWGADSTHLTIDPSKFSNSAEITNPWFPLKPGMVFDYIGTAVDDEGKVIPRKMQINVTDLTKDVGGIRARVTWDVDWSEGQVVEAELALFAQDVDGNVWLMGEYPEEYDDGNGVVTGNPAWFHGVDGAKAGIIVPAEAKLTGATFSQGWSSLVGYSDRGRVDSVGVRNCVPLDCYDDLMVIAESSGDEVEVEQLKYYSRGLGNTRAHWRGKNDKEHQTLELTKVTQLDAKGLAKVRSSALALEKKAIKGNTSYQQTKPIENARSANP